MLFEKSTKGKETKTEQGTKGNEKINGQTKAKRKSKKSICAACELRSQLL